VDIILVALLKTLIPLSKPRTTMEHVSLTIRVRKNKWKNKNFEVFLSFEWKS